MQVKTYKVLNVQRMASQQNPHQLDCCLNAHCAASELAGSSAASAAASSTAEAAADIDAVISFFQGHQLEDPPEPSLAAAVPPHAAASGRAESAVRALEAAAAVRFEIKSEVKTSPSGDSLLDRWSASDEVSALHVHRFSFKQI